MPPLGIEDNVLRSEFATIATVEFVKEYLDSYGDNFEVTIVVANDGIPEDFVRTLSGYDKTGQMIRGMNSNASNICEAITLLYESGYDISPTYVHDFELIAEKDLWYTRFLQERNAYLTEYKNSTEEDYGRKLQLDIQAKYGYSSNYALVQITGLNKNTFSKFIKAETKKHDKAILLRIALAMKLSLEDFCMYIWATGDAFPYDDRDYLILNYLYNDIYDIEQIDCAIEDCYGMKQRLTKKSECVIYER